jgi:predicted O-methyltransferase YrrM
MISRLSLELREKFRRKITSWSVEETLIDFLISLIEKFNIRRILEFGPGLSTEVFQECLKEKGDPRILVSVEHDLKFFQKLKKEFTETWIKVIHAPLKPLLLNNHRYIWYNFEPRSLNIFFDLVLIDGPPSVQLLTRYPALPIIDKYLKPGGHVLLDDLKRKSEKAVVQKWKAEFPNYSFTELCTERGACYLRKKEDQ